jgi:hypothetical protein
MKNIALFEQLERTFNILTIINIYRSGVGTGCGYGFIDGNGYGNGINLYGFMNGNKQLTHEDNVYTI